MLFFCDSIVILNFLGGFSFLFYIELVNNSLDIELNTTLFIIKNKMG